MKAIPFTDNTKVQNIRKDIEDSPKDFLRKKLMTEGKYSFGVSNIVPFGYYKELGFIYYLTPLRSFPTF